MQIQHYLSNIPRLHTWDGGATWNTGGFDAYHLGPLISFLQTHKCKRIVETGAGNSTIAFILSGATHVTSIAPERPLLDRILSYCRDNEIDHSALTPILGFSEWELPKLAAQVPASFEFALIDGAHGWPYVFVDFFYVHALVREGGYIMLDDTQLHSVAELIRWLKEQPGYSLVLDVGKSLVFQKERNTAGFPEWNGQPYIVRLSG